MIRAQTLIDLNLLLGGVLTAVTLVGLLIVVAVGGRRLGKGGAALFWLGAALVGVVMLVLLALSIASRMRVNVPWPRTYEVLNVLAGCAPLLLLAGVVRSYSEGRKAP